MTKTRPARPGLPPINIDRSVQNLAGGRTRKVELSFLRVRKGHNPRGYLTGARAFQGAGFDALVKSIAEHGDVLQAILVRPMPDSPFYEIAAGERRFHAAKAAGLMEVSVDIRELTDDQMVLSALDENALREEVPKVDLILYLLDAVAKRSGVPKGDLRRLFMRIRDRKADAPLPDPGSPEALLEDAAEFFRFPSHSTVVRSWTRLALLNDDELDAVRGGLPEDAALELLGVTDEQTRADLLAQAVAGNWSAPQMRRAIEALKKVEHGREGIQKAVKRLSALTSNRALGKMDPEQLSKLQRDIDAIVQKYSGSA